MNDRREVTTLQKNMKTSSILVALTLGVIGDGLTGTVASYGKAEIN